MKIGILGGIGPEATNYFYKKLTKKLQKENQIKSNKDFPQIIINSIPAPELINKKITEKELRPYLKGIKELEKLKPDFIVMACNTIHLYHKKLQRKTKIPIINLKEIVKNYLEKNKITSLLVIGTPSTINKGLYDFKKIKTIKPTKKEQEILSKVIYNYNKGFEKQKQIKNTKKIIQKYLYKKSQKVILGCTEFEIMLKNQKDSIKPLSIIVDSIINNKSYK